MTRILIIALFMFVCQGTAGGRENITETEEKSIRDFLKTDADDLKYSSSPYRKQGASLYLAVFKKNPAIADSIFASMISTLEDLKEQQPSSKDSGLAVWETVFRGGNSDHEILLHFLEKLDRQDMELLDLAARNSYHLRSRNSTEVPLISTALCKDLPDFYTFSGESRSLLLSVVKEVNGFDRIRKALEKSKDKRFGTRLILDLLSPVRNENINEILSVLGKRIEQIRSLPSEHRQDFYRFFEASSKRLPVIEENLSEDAAAFYILYRRERPAYIHDALKDIFGNQDVTGEFTQSQAQLIIKYYILGHQREAMNCIMRYVEKKAGKNGILAPFIPTYHAPVEYAHFLFLQAVEYDDEMSKDFLSERMFYQLHESRIQWMTWSDYLIRNPAAFLKTPFAGDHSGFSALPVNKRESAYDCLLEEVIASLFAATPEQRKNFHEVMKLQESSFGTDLFTALSSEGNISAADTLEKVANRSSAISRDSRRSLKIAILKYGNVLSTQDPEFYQHLSSQYTEYVSRKIDLLLSFGTCSYIVREAPDFFTDLIVINPEKAEELLAEIIKTFEKNDPQSALQNQHNLLAQVCRNSKSSDLYFWCLNQAEKIDDQQTLPQFPNSAFIKDVTPEKLLNTPISGNPDTFRMYASNIIRRRPQNC